MKKPYPERWQEYEREKRKIASRNLTPSEYEEEIRKLAKRLKV